MSAPLMPPLPDLSDAFLASLEDIAQRSFGAQNPRGAALAQAVEQVSTRYTRERGQLAHTTGEPAALAARLRFFLPRDLLKLWGPLAELSATGSLPERETLRVLDLGAGLGTSTLSLASYAATHGPCARLQVTAADADRRALAVMAELLQRARGLARVPVELTTVDTDLARAAPPGGPFDIALVGLCLNELLATHGDDARRAEMGERWLRRVSDQLAPGGVLIVLEPALRSHSRVLAMIRDRLVESDRPPHVYGPCVGAPTCPLLTRKRDWCHQHVAWPLPHAVAELARDAGLRREGLTYSYLTLHTEPRNVATLTPDPGDVYRVVSAPLRSKGKLELSLCGARGGMRLMSLDRHRPHDPDVLTQVGRGSVVALAEDELEADPRGGRARLRRGCLPRILRDA